MAQQGIVALLRGASKRWLGSSSVQRSTLPPSMYSLSRAFSSKLFVGGLSYHTNEEMLRKAFEEHGEVVDVRIITDRETGRSRGFGFISFRSESDAEAAKAKMSNHLLDGRFIRVDLASNRPPQSQASPRPPSTSPSGFSFGTPGTRPPSVEDWGPLSSYTSSWASNSSINTSSQGAPDSFNGGPSPSSSSFSSVTTTVSGGFEQSSSSSNTVTSFQSTSSASEIQSSSIDDGISTRVASGSTEQGAVLHSGVVLPTVPSAHSTEGICVNDSASGNASNFQMGMNRVSPEAGQASSTQTGSSMHGSNVNVVSESGSRPKMGSGVSNTATSTESNEGSTKYEFPGISNKPRDEMEEWKRRLALPSKNLGPKRTEVWQAKLTEAAIPPAKGPLYDFGLGAFPDAPPPLDAGANPQGGFDPNVCLDELPPEAEPVRLPYSIFTARTLPPLDLPYETPEADNWSVIGKPPRRIEDSPYSPFSPDLKDDPEFWWDPYDFDPEAKLLKEAFAEEPVEESKAAETKPSDDSGAEEARTLKEGEAEETTAINAAVL